MSEVVEERMAEIVITIVLIVTIMIMG